MTNPDDFADDPALTALARSLLDGTPVEWGTTTANHDDEARSRILGQMRVLADLAGLHRGSAKNDAPSPDAPADVEWWGHLKILERIGHGAFGDVYRGWDSRLDRDVAVKLLRGLSLPDRALTGTTFIEEGRLLARVRHPNVVTVYGAERIAGRIGIWTEFIHGRTLAEIVRDEGVFDARAAARVGSDLCRALTAIHHAGLVHRDVKPQNVMRERSGRIVLMDFGAGVEHAVQAADGSRAGQLVGTPLYLAPEILEGGLATPRSDLYSLGVLLYYLITADFPFKGDRIDDVREAHRTRGGVRLIERRPDVPRAFAAIVSRALDPDPANRFADAAAMEAALNRFCRRPSRRALAIGVVIAAVAVLLVTISAAIWSMPTRLQTDMIPAVARPASLQILGAQALPALVDPTARSSLPELPNPPTPQYTVLPIVDTRIEDATVVEEVRSALDAALSASPAMRVVPPERARELLALTRRDKDLQISLPVARDIAQRDATIQYVVRVRAWRPGERYYAGVQIYDPATLAEISYRHEAYDTPFDVRSAIARVVARAIADLAVRSSPGTLNPEPITATSVDAAKLYTLADTAAARGDWPTASELLDRALILEPDLAAAEILKATALAKLNRPREEYLAHADRALEHASRVQPWERHWIRARHITMTSGYARAVDEYAALLDIRPDHALAAIDFIIACEISNRRSWGAEYVARAAEAQPANFDVNFRAIEALTTWSPDVERASMFARRATALSHRTTDSGQIAFVRFFPAFANWLRGDVAAADRHAADVARELAAVDVSMREQANRFGAAFALTIGQLNEAKQRIDQLPRTAPMRAISRAHLHALWAVQRDDIDELRGAVRVFEGNGTINTQGWPLSTWLTAKAGGSPALDEFLKRMQKQPHATAVAMGELAFQQNRTLDAIPLLQDAIKDSQGLGGLPFLLAVPLAQALEKEDRLAEAIVLLESVGRDQNRTYALSGSMIGSSTGFAWLRSQAELVKLYAAAGRRQDEQRLRTKLLGLLSLSDKDHPIRTQLER